MGRGFESRLRLSTVEKHLTRRRLLELGLALPLVAAACSGDEEQETLAPTPACDDGDELTPEQTEGPFFTPDSPERESLLEPGIDGTTLVIAGTVLATDCTPISGALLDFWHADAAGEYDNEGYRLRGHQFADVQGRYRLETIEPGLYTGRTRHIHVKAQAPEGTVLTTQLYFPDEAGNASDSIFDPALVVNMTEPGSGQFDFVLAPG